MGADHWERGETEETQQVFPEPQGQPGPAAAELARTDGQLGGLVRSGPAEAAAGAVPRLVVVVGLRCMVEEGVETMKADRTMLVVTQ